MDWRVKVELFEQIRREYEFGAGTINSTIEFRHERKVARTKTEGNTYHVDA